MDRAADSWAPRRRQNNLWESLDLPSAAQEFHVNQLITRRSNCCHLFPLQHVSFELFHCCQGLISKKLRCKVWNKVCRLIETFTEPLDAFSLTPDIVGRSHPWLEHPHHFPLAPDPVYTWKVEYFILQEWNSTWMMRDCQQAATGQQTGQIP